MKLNLNDPAVDDAVLGHLAEEFMSTQLYKFMIAKATVEAEDAVAELVRNAHIWSQEQIHHAQAIIWRAEKFEEWLIEAYTAGQQALELLKEEANG